MLTARGAKFLKMNSVLLTGGLLLAASGIADLGNSDAHATASSKAAIGYVVALLPLSILFVPIAASRGLVVRILAAVPVAVLLAVFCTLWVKMFVLEDLPFEFNVTSALLFAILQCVFVYPIWVFVLCLKLLLSTKGD